MEACGGFPKFRGPLLEVPYVKDYTILGVC